MSLTHRHPRPLVRDKVAFRDDRLFIVACDDTFAPKQYFDFFRITRVQIHVIPSEPGLCAAQHVLDRLRNIDHESDDERWMLLDTDHYIQPNHIQSFLTAIADARRLGIKVALSRPCFELWLLLHHANENSVRGFENAQQVTDALRAVLGQYNKTSLRRRHYPYDAVVEAFFRAERLDEMVAGGEIPDSTTTRVYQLWRAIVDKALTSQLPPELARLKRN